MCTNRLIHSFYIEINSNWITGYIFFEHVDINNFLINETKMYENLKEEIMH
jgi:hypothetical protein